MSRIFSKAMVGKGAAILVAAVVLVLSQSALARGGKGHGKGHGKRHGPDPEHRVKVMSVILDLTEEQEKAIFPILKQEAEEVRAVHEKYRGQGRENRGQAHDEMIAIREKYSGLIQAELTDEQAKKYRELEDLRREKGNLRREKRGRQREK